MDTSENVEATIVAVGVTCEATAAYLAALPIPDSIKLPVVMILGIVGFVILTFWKAKVNKQ